MQLIQTGAAVRDQVQSSFEVPPRLEISQHEIERILDQVWCSTGRFDIPLEVLERWSHAVGYYEHIRQPNDLLVFPCEQLKVNLRLQINYTRLDYKAPPKAESKSETEYCPLCYYNVASKQKPLLRAFRLAIGKCASDKTHFAHLTPFPLCLGHFVLNRLAHEPMQLDKDAINDALAFLALAPGWLVASNSDVEWAGASILTHHHAQVFRELRLPLEDATEHSQCTSQDGVTASVLHWLGPVLRVAGPPDAVAVACSKLINAWKSTDAGRATCNFLARMPGPDTAVVHVILRHPQYRTYGSPAEIKPEGVGIIEMAGEVIVPPLPHLTRSENKDYFSSVGYELAAQIIGMNSPETDPERCLKLCEDVLAMAGDC